MEDLLIVVFKYWILSNIFQYVSVQYWMLLYIFQEIGKLLILYQLFFLPFYPLFVFANMKLIIIPLIPHTYCAGVQSNCPVSRLLYYKADRVKVNYAIVSFVILNCIKVNKYSVETVRPLPSAQLGTA